MKNSLFKRAIAAVATVPLALTQCLGVANAATVEDSALSLKETGSVKADDSSNKTITLTGKGGVLYITPDEEFAKYELQADGKTFIQDSAWNVKAYTALSNVEKKKGTFDMSKVYEQAINKSGQYKEIIQSVIDKLGDFTYSIDNDGNITIEGSLDDIMPTFAEGGNKTVSGALNELAAKYNIPELKKDRDAFKGIVIAGKGKIFINAETLQNSKEVGAKLTFTDASGKVWNGAGLLDYIIESFEAMKEAAKKTVDKYADRLDIEDAYATIDKEVNFYENKVKWGKSKLDSYSDGNFSFESANAESALATLQSRLEKSRITKYKYYTNHKESIPDSGEDAATKNWAKRVFRAFANNVKNLAAPYTVDFTLDDVGTEIDRVTDIFVQLTKEQVGVASAVYPDDEFAEVVSYFETAYPEYEVVSSHKEIVGTADYSNLYADAEFNAEAGLEFVRVVEVAPREESTTTTTSEEPIDTTTTTTESGEDVSDETTTTTESGEDISDETTTTTDNGEISDETTTTTVSGDVTTVSTDVTTDTNVSTDVTTDTTVSTDVTTDTNVSTDVTTDTNVSTDVTTDTSVSTDVTTDTTVSTDVTTDTNVSTDVTTDTNVSTDVTTDTNVSTDVTTDTSVSTDVTTDTNVSTDVTTDTNVSTDVTTDTNISTDVTTDTNVSTDVTTDTNVSTDVTTVSSTDGEISDETTTTTDGEISDETTTTTDGEISDETTTTTDGEISDETTTTTDGEVSDETTTTTDGEISDETTTTSDEEPSEETTTTSGGGIVEPGGVYAVATAAVVDGYYFSHDSRPFDKGHVEGAISIVDVDEDGVESEPVPMDMSKVTFKEVNSGADNPAGAFKGPNSLMAYTIDDFYYEVQVFYNGELLKYKDGTPVSFHVFIGVKGDANFDMKVDATDASSILGYFAKLSVAKSDDERENTRLSPSTCALVNSYPGLDDFAAFLVDVDLDVYSEGNNTMAKSDRQINSSDASWVLSFYSKSSTGAYADKTAEYIWNEVIKGREEQMKAILG